MWLPKMGFTPKKGMTPSPLFSYLVPPPDGRQIRLGGALKEGGELVQLPFGAGEWVFAEIIII
jgi:hypothetical protein